MNLRPLLYPFSLIYGGITLLRNKLFDFHIVKSSEFDLPIICVGNLNTGGTGKTPHIEYLIRLLKPQYQLATLSRGYGRTLRGFQEVSIDSLAQEIGDEPLQFKIKFEDVGVFVNEKRVEGVIDILSENPETELILLDDAFQHRAIKAGLNILLTQYSNPFYEDSILPSGDLREAKAGVERAEIIIVTKCPDSISLEKRNQMRLKINRYTTKEVYFSRIRYQNNVTSVFENELISVKDLKGKKHVLVTGIANTESMTSYLKSEQIEFVHLSYRDHYKFKESDISKILNIFAELNNENTVIITTEKDAMRLRAFKELERLPLYYLGIEIEIIEEKEKFDNQIIAYVRNNKRVN